MRNKNIWLLSVLLLLPLSSSHLSGAEKTLALGKYDFYHYFPYAELTSYLQDMNKAFPQLTQLTTLATSPEGRDVWMLVINNPKTGKPEDKPGFFLNQIHAGEVIAAASACYTVNYLLSNYGKDPQVTALVDSLAIYVVPRLDVDGAEASLTGKGLGESQDIDGDKVIAQMRKKDPEGEWKASPLDPRLMVRRQLDETEGPFYKTFTEGLDSNGDGKISTERPENLSNRNYPGNWQPEGIQGGGKLYPMQEKITRAEVDFVATHPNIAVYLQHHCCGRVILRPPTTTLDKDFKYQNDLDVFRVATARGLDKAGWALGTSVFDWENGSGVLNNKKSSQVYRDRTGTIRNAPTGMFPQSDAAAAPGTDDEEFGGGNMDQLDRGYFAWGSSLETMYNIFGVFSMADEHWREPDYDGDGEVSEVERLKWNDTEMGGKVFVGWHAFKQPQLGDVEIGGWPRAKVSPPEGELIQKECEAGNRYTMYIASLAPHIKIKHSELKVIDQRAGLYQVDVSVENTGVLRTATEMAEGLKAVKPVTLEVQGDDNLEILIGEKRVDLGQIKGSSTSKSTSYLIRVKDPARKGTLKISAVSARAGRDARDVPVQIAAR